MSGLDDLRDELVAAAERQVRPRARWRPAVPRGLTLLVTVAVLGGGTATALTVVSSPAPDDPYDPVVTAGTMTVKAVPLTRADRERLRRQREALAPRTDARRSFAVLAEPARADGLRLAVANGTARVFVRATDRETCVRVFASSSAPGSCSTARRSRRTASRRRSTSRSTRWWSAPHGRRCRRSAAEPW